MAGESVASWVPRFSNLLVTRTLSKAHSLAGFRVGYGIFPEDVADDLNGHNDAYPLARASQAAALATLRHEERIRERAEQLRGWTEALAAQLRGLGLRTFPTQTYFFLADFAPHDAAAIAGSLARQQILVKPMVDPALGPTYMRITTARPEDNGRFVHALKEDLSDGQD
jgi:histidinol-phosphate aminotransferase